jgi:hypothetical protein
VNRGFQFEVLFGESDWHLGPFRSRNRIIIDDGVHRPELNVSLLLSFEFHGRPSRNWHDGPERWQGFRVLGSLNLILVLTNYQVVVERFLELAVVAGLTELPKTEGKIAERVAMMVVVVEIAALRLDLVESS